jgi:hypothetical protein
MAEAKREEDLSESKEEEMPLCTFLAQWTIPEGITLTPRDTHVPVKPRIGHHLLHYSQKFVLIDTTQKQILHQIPDSSNEEVLHMVQVDSQRILVGYMNSTIKLIRIEENRIVTTPAWENEHGERGDLGCMDVTQNREKFIFSHGLHLSLGSLATGEIEATWKSGTEEEASTVKVLSPNFVLTGQFDSYFCISDFTQQKSLIRIDIPDCSMYQAESFCNTKLLLAWTLEGMLMAYTMPNFSPLWELEAADSTIMYLDEIFPNFLILFDLHSFHFFDLISTKIVDPPYPNFICKKEITWVDPLPNRNFLVHSEDEEYVVLDFCSKMWENLFRWLFLGFSDTNSTFSCLLPDILIHICKVGRFSPYVF